MSNGNDMNDRLHEVEQWKAGAEERFKTLFRLAGEQSAALDRSTNSVNKLTETVTLLTTQIAIMNAQSAMRKECADPSACLKLTPRIDALEKKETAFAGSWKGVAFVFSCAAAFIAAAAGVGSIIKMVLTHKP